MLDPRHTFARFVVGATNRLAAMAARRVAESPSPVYNPLFLTGGAGVGKTHLLQAIAHEAQTRRGSEAVRYATLDGFMDELGLALGKGALDEFRRGWAACEFVLLDELQGLSGKARTQEELLRLWDAWAQRGTQLVFAADRPPHELGDVDERLATRLVSGLVVDIAPPDPEVRLGVVRLLAAEQGIRLGEGVAEALAQLAVDNVRALQGAFHQLALRQEAEGRLVRPDEVPLLVGLPPEVRDEFRAFLADIEQTVAELVETAPWRRRIGEAILRWEAEGYRTRRLEEALEADRPPEVDALLARFEEDVRRLQEIEAALRELDALPPDPTLLRDPDRLGEAEARLAAARMAAQPLPSPPPGPTLAQWRAAHPAAEMAAQAVARVAERLGALYNPLVIHGPERSGKTQLLAALAHEAETRRPGLRLGYVTGEQLGQEILAALRSRAPELWRRRYRALNLLLLDDLTSFPADPAAHEELFFLIDNLLRAGAQLAVATDQPPAALTSFDPRLRTRLESGLRVDLDAALAAAAVGLTIDRWFLQRDKIPWDWLALEDRLWEELA